MRNSAKTLASLLASGAILVASSGNLNALRSYDYKQEIVSRVAEEINFNPRKAIILTGLGILALIYGGIFWSYKKEGKNGRIPEDR